MTARYPAEELDSEEEDDGTMPENLAELGEAVVGHRITKVEQKKAVEIKTSTRWTDTDLVLTLDNGTRVVLVDTEECCAHTRLDDWILHLDKIDHVITGVGTTGRYTRWHIYADLGDVLELTVDWSAGNPFYYVYGFAISVLPAPPVL